MTFVYLIINREVYGSTRVVGVYTSREAAESALQQLLDQEDFWDDNLYEIETHELKN